jgi:hypothetical protein
MTRSITNPPIPREGEAPAEPPNMATRQPANQATSSGPRPARPCATVASTVVAEPAGAQTPTLDVQVGDLLAVLSPLHQLLKRLLQLARAKLDAMRRADAVALQRCAAEECGLLERVFAHEDRRNAALARLAQTLHSEDAPRARLAEIAQRLPEPFSSRLRARTAGLRRTADELRQKNRLAADVARHLHDHIRAVFDDVARVNQESVVYGPSGKHQHRTNETWVDAVG